MVCLIVMALYHKSKRKSEADRQVLLMLSSLFWSPSTALYASLKAFKDAHALRLAVRRLLRAGMIEYDRVTYGESRYRRVLKYDESEPDALVRAMKRFKRPAPVTRTKK
jgi:hypothetical protein